MKIDENGVLYELEPRDVVDGTLIVPEGVKKIDWGNIIEGKIAHESYNRHNYEERDINLYAEGSRVEKIKLPNTLIELCDNCFSNFAKLENIILPDSVTKIGTGCFKDCKALKQIRLSRSLEEIPAEAFIGCELDHLVIPDSVRSIDQRTFGNQSASNDVYSIVDYFRFPKKMEYANVFLLNNVGTRQGKKNIILPKEVDELNLNYKNPYDEIVMPNKLELNKSKGLEIIERDSSKFKFRNKIGSKSFEKVIDNLKNEETPIGRKEIGMSDIEKTRFQSPAIIIKGVDVIGEFAFAECQNLEEVIIKEGVKSIERGAFAFCPNLKRIELPTSIEHIGSRAFWGCESLERNSN